MKAIEAYLTSNRERFVDELAAFVRIPSVGSDPDLREAMGQAAAWAADRLARAGFYSEKISTDGCPLVYAESPPVAGAPICLVYGHYDVQPAGRADEWRTPPFEPVLREGHLYGRGASDDKGQILANINSAEAWLKTAGHLPIQVKFLIEGEEEIGGLGIERFLESNTEKLACDCMVVSDGNQFGPGLPAITYGLRGVLCYELRIDGPNRELHSGSFGGCVANPANALADVLASLRDSHGRVVLPGFYDDVVSLSDAEHREWSVLPFGEGFRQPMGVQFGRGYVPGL